MKIIIPKNAKVIMDKLNNFGFKSYICGGAVRDAILEREIHDYDICTSAKPEEMLKIFKDFHIIETGIKHGTVTVIIGDGAYEITTFRIDGHYSDNRHPDSVEFVEDIVSDLSRRDFTINAMAYNEQEGLIDPFNGSEDLENHIIRCVGDANERFKEDPLRMLRVFRFRAQLDFFIDLQTDYAIYKNSHLINTISKERIRDEIVKILMSDRPEYIYNLHIYGIMKDIIPCLNRCFETEQNNPYHNLDVGRHTIKSLKQSPLDLETRVALMLHDIGKPISKTTDGMGIDHFHCHEFESARLAKRWLEEYKFDNQSIKNITSLVKYHDFLAHANKRSLKKLLKEIDYVLVYKLFDIRLQDMLAQNLEFFEDGRMHLERLKNYLETIKNDNETFKINQLEINGDDLIKIGYKEGREIGLCLNYLLDLVIGLPSLNKKEKLLSIAESYKEN